MFNVIMIITFINFLISWLSGRKSYGTLNCGIFAWVGTSSDKFNPVLFNVLGVYNDSRGGDSCGVYFNRGLIHGIGTESKYEDLVKSKKLHTTIKPGRWPLVIGHCRKASSGAVTSINVQPVEVRKGESKKLSYIQAHNGTITNHKELADKYKVSYTAAESDSVVMSRVIDKVGFDVLAEYEGSAAMVMHFTKEPNSIYAFHGESKDYNVVREERPLHFIQMGDLGTYISSEARPLEFISNGAKATSFKYNTLYKLTGNEVVEVKSIPRTNAVQKKSNVSTSSTNPYAYGYGWKDEEEWDEKTRRWVPVHKAAQSVIPFRDKVNNVSCSYSNRGVVPNICCSTIDADLRVIGSDNKIYYEKGFYNIKNDLAHGRYIVDAWGWVKTPESQTSLQKYVLYFVYGILVTGEEAYNDIMGLLKIADVKCASDFFRQDIFADIDNVLAYYSVYPYTRRIFTPNSGVMTPTSFFPNGKGDEKNTYYTGDFQPLFSSLEYSFDTGDLEGYRKIDSILTIDKFLKENEYFQDTEFAIKLEVEEAKRKVEAEELKSNDDTIIQDCTDCCKYSLDDNNQRCFTCDIQFGVYTVADIRGYDKHKKDLLELLSNNLTPMVDDLEQLAGDIKEQDKTNIIKDEYNVIVSVKEQLNKLIS